MSKSYVSDEVRQMAAPDEFGRYHVFAVYSREPGQREIVSRNLSLATAEELAEYLEVRGHKVHVSLDTCG